MICLLIQRCFLIFVSMTNWKIIYKLLDLDYNYQLMVVFLRYFFYPFYFFMDQLPICLIDDHNHADYYKHQHRDIQLSFSCIHQGKLYFQIDLISTCFFFYFFFHLYFDRHLILECGFSFHTAVFHQRMFVYHHV
jgi:hypothetical protein